ncbi:CLUMA_CG013564, isoform A [Clunio marinus]|uniref:CLUMA_CG013564, isoform A n=1 Tax=Clunio marinus TaxID=568069 RepID=A0A1J1IJ89_9DIPT|nr:CLUMA_CG013564, isoform A [Clunio marinus]
MMIFKDSSPYVLLLVVFVANVTCDDESSDDTSSKIKREASIDDFNIPNMDLSKHDGTILKTLLNENTDNIRHDAVSPFDDLNSRIKMGKTTVEFWPSDMDKEKFFNLTKDSPLSSPIDFWPKGGLNQEVHMEVNNNNREPEKLPDVPINHQYIPDIAIDKFSEISKPDFTEYQPMFEAGPTEIIIVDDDAITSRAPITFPTSEPTSKSPDHTIAIVTRGGNNKKRKLKKKVKTADVTMPFSEISVSITPSSNTVIDTMVDKSNNMHNINDYNNIGNGFQSTPIYENIDEPFIDVFKSVRYTDVISNLANLTELSFSSNRINKTDNSEVVDRGLPVDINPITSSTDLTSVNNINDISDLTSSTVSSQMLNSSDELLLSRSIIDSPLDIMLNQLKSAIEERNITKIKIIVNAYEEPETKTENIVIIMNATENAIATESSSSAMETMSDVTTAKVKVHTASRVRNFQRKFKKQKPQILNDVLKENINIITGTETLPPSTVSDSVSQSTESITKVDTSSMKPIVVRSRSYLTMRKRNTVTRISRHSPRNNRRRNRRRPAYTKHDNKKE